MGRMTRRTKAEPVAQTDAVVGRDIIDGYQKQNEAAADLLTEGEAVQYFHDGWRYGKIETLPAADEPRYGEVRILHALTGRLWVAARNIRRIA
jgi:hypothetical protein